MARHNNDHTWKHAVTEIIRLYVQMKYIFVHIKH